MTKVRAQGTKCNRARIKIFVAFRRFLQILAFSWKSKHLGNADFHTKLLICTYYLYMKLQQTAGTRRKPQIGVRPLTSVP